MADSDGRSFQRPLGGGEIVTAMLRDIGLSLWLFRERHDEDPVMDPSWGVGGSQGILESAARTEHHRTIAGGLFECDRTMGLRIV